MSEAGALTALHRCGLWRGLGWSMVGVVVVLSLTPSPPSVPGLLGWDKLQHLLTYAGLTFWFCQVFRGRWRWAGLVFALGVVLELLQGLSAHRNLEVLDMVANGLGVACGLLLVLSPAGRLIPYFDRMLQRGLGRD